MKKWVTLFLLFFAYCISAQQLNIDVRVEGMLSANNFIVKNGDKYATAELYVTYDEATKEVVAKLMPNGITGTLDEVLKANNAAQQSVRNIADYKTGTPQEMMAQLEAIQFIYPSDTLDNDSDVKYFKSSRVYFYNQARYDYACLETSIMSVNNKKQIRRGNPVSLLYRMIPVTVNSTYTFIALLPSELRGGSRGYIWAYKGKFSVKITDNPAKGTPAVATLAPDKKPFFSNYLPVSQVKQVSGKWGLYEPGTNMAIVTPVYDSIKTGHAVFVGFKSKEAEAILADGTLKPLPPISAVFISNAVISVISGGNVHYISEDGNLTDKRPLGTGGECGTVPRIRREISVKDGFYICTETREYGNTTVAEYKLCKASDYAGLTLWNGTKKDEHMATGPTPNYIFSTYYAFITTTSQGKKGVVRIQYNAPSPVLEIILAPDNYIFHTDENSYPYLFEKNGLKNYFGISRKLKYSRLGPLEKYSFARFTLPNGKQGWLSLDGKEYLDE